MDRRSFLKTIGAGLLPLFIPLDHLDFGVPKQKLILPDDTPLYGGDKWEILTPIEDDYHSIGFDIAIPDSGYTTGQLTLSPELQEYTKKDLANISAFRDKSTGIYTTTMTAMHGFMMLDSVNNTLYYRYKDEWIEVKDSEG